MTQSSSDSSEARASASQPSSTLWRASALRTGDRRPTTSRVVVYRHRDTELPDDLPLEDLAQPQVLHTRDVLTKVILLDFPDFDSAESSHAKILKRYLTHLDVLFVVVDDMKYADLALYQLLSQLDHDTKNLFALFNKVDKLQRRYPGRAEEVELDLQADFRSKLADHAGILIDPSRQFAIAAKAVLDVRLDETNDETERADGRTLQRFAAIERVVERYQQDKHRRAAKERNLDARKARLAEQLHRSAIGKENEAIIRESQALVATWRNELAKSMASISTEVFTDELRRGIRRTRLRRETANWPVPLSLIMTMMTEFFARGRTGADRTPAELAARFHAHYQPFFQSLQNLQQRFAAEFVGSELAETNESAGETAVKSETLTLESARNFQAKIEQKTDPPKRLSRWVAHTPAIGVLAMAIWSRLYPILASATGESDRGIVRSIFGALITSLSPTFLIGTVVCVILAYILTAFWIWLRVVQRADADILEGESEIRDDVRHFGEQTVARLDAEVHHLHEEFTQVQRIFTA